MLIDCKKLCVEFSIMVIGKLIIYVYIDYKVKCVYLKDFMKF